MDGPTSKDDGLPVRLVSRLTTELGMLHLQQSLRLVPRRLETSIVAQALIRCALPELTRSAVPSLPGSAPVIGSIGSIARSFGRSPETIRRHVHILARQNFFTVERDGVRLAPSYEAGERILNHLRNAHDSILWFIQELSSWNLIKRRLPRRDTPVPLERVLRASMDLRLLGFESFRGPLGGWTAMAIWNVLSGVSVRHVTTDRHLSGMFVRRSTPDELRRPTSVRALCATSGLPYATVWRHLGALEKAGKVGRKGEGFVVLTAQLLTRDMEARVVRYVEDVLDRVNKLVAEGIDPAAIPSLYLEGKPTLVPIR